MQQNCVHPLPIHVGLYSLRHSIVHSDVEWNVGSRYLAFSPLIFQIYCSWVGTAARCCRSTFLHVMRRHIYHQAATNQRSNALVYSGLVLYYCAVAHLPPHPRILLCILRQLSAGIARRCVGGVIVLSRARSFQRLLQQLLFQLRWQTQCDVKSTRV